MEGELRLLLTPDRIASFAVQEVEIGVWVTFFVVYQDCRALRLRWRRTFYLTECASSVSWLSCGW